MSTVSIEHAFAVAVEHHQAGRLVEAQKIYECIVSQHPEHAEAFDNLGCLFQSLGHFETALQCHRRATQLRPNHAAGFNNLGSVLETLGREGEAIDALRSAIAFDPNFAEPHCNIGNIFRARGQLNEATTAYRAALSIDPHLALAWSNLGNVLRELCQFDESLAAAQRAVQLAPTADHFSCLGNALRAQGRSGEAIEAFRQAIRVDPTRADLHSNLVYSLYFLDDFPASKILEEHREWEAQHAAHFEANVAPHPNDHDPNRRLKIGYASPGFVAGGIARFMQPLLAAHDRERFAIVCYSDCARPDSATAKVRELADYYRDTRLMSDEQLASQIRADAIDILVDLTVHAAGNRMLAFARKPAPIQVTYLGYPGTTGLKTMDYRLTDEHLDPPGTPQFCTEQPLYLPQAYWCDPSPGELPPIAPLPCEASGRITFGCLNSFCKVAPRALATWRRLLDHVPNSRLLLHGGPGALGVRETLGDRCEFVPRLSRVDYFSTYNKIDVALDPCPYCGGTTTLDALWMGVPVVTLAGEMAVHRAGVSILNNVGLPELIARNADEYVEIAARLAMDLPRLAELRSTMRERLNRSPLTNSKTFVQDVEMLYREIWQRWCQTAVAC